MSNFYLIFISIILEGFPFIIIGALISAFLEVCLSENFVKKFAGNNSIKNIVIFGSAGFFFPICECGIVPVAGRLRKKGVATGPMLAYLLSAPAFQPIVLFSTFAAFNNRIDIALIRIFGSLIIALIIAYLMRNNNSEKQVSAVVSEIETNHNHDENNCCCGHEHNHTNECQSKKNSSFYSIIREKLPVFLQAFLNDASLILVYLSIGAAAATLVSYYNPINLYGEHHYFKFLEIIIMIIFAFILSVCSEADAFIAYSFAHFSLAAKLAFMWFGPMMDIKLLVLYFKIFNKKFVVKTVALCFITVFLFALIFQFIWN